MLRREELYPQGGRSPPTEVQIAELEPCPLDESTGLFLKSVGWTDGSRLWIDDRGLLHLRSSDARVPELTLTLHEGELAGWTSTGKVFGHRYYLNPNAIPVTGRRVECAH